MRPAEITDATRHVETTANAEIHTTLLSYGCATVWDYRTLRNYAQGMLSRTREEKATIVPIVAA
jgi:hypothetical protein